MHYTLQLTNTILKLEYQIIPKGGCWKICDGIAMQKHEQTEVSQHIPHYFGAGE
jgi:hypothetical protein